MSNFNYDWLKENFSQDNVFFDIGAADLAESVTIRNLFPSAKIFAFECCNDWLTKNLIRSKEHNISYYHKALSDVNGETMFFPSKEFKGQPWSFSGSIFEPDLPLLTDIWKWDNPYFVSCISIDAFCEENNVRPDFIFMDVQGAEYQVLSKLKDIRPKAIWAEITEFSMYKTGTTYEKFVQYMKSLGYIEHKDKWDSLFVLNSAQLSNYTSR